MKRLFLLLVLCVGFLYENAFAQGCSDAGFCTIGTLGHHSVDTVRERSVSLIFTSGIGDEGVFIFTPAVQYDHRFTSAFAVQGKITFNYASGNLGNATGAGDFYATGIFHLPSRTAPRFATTVTAGFKFPLNKSDLTADGTALPMPYQSSLGTTDIIAGVSVSDARWQFTLGWQQPLTESNENSFVPEAWTDPDAAEYVPSNMLRRKGDMLFRTIYTARATRQVSINAGLLAIYHLGNDSYRSVGSDMDIVTLDNSEGLTLNVTAALFWAVSDKWRLGLNAGFPVVVRDVRPDGLTRSFVLAPEARFSF